VQPMRKLKTLSEKRITDLLINSPFGSVPAILAVWSLSDGGTRGVLVEDILRIEDLTGLTRWPLVRALNSAVEFGWLERIGPEYVLGNSFFCREVKEKRRPAPTLVVIKGGR